MTAGLERPLKISPGGYDAEEGGESEAEKRNDFDAKLVCGEDDQQPGKQEQDCELRKRHVSRRFSDGSRLRREAGPDRAANDAEQQKSAP